MSNIKASFVAVIIGGTALLNAGFAAAEGPRETGVGVLIAAQGNQALLSIKRDIRAQVRQLGPAPLPTRVLDTAQHRHSDTDASAKRDRIGSQTF